MTLTNEGKGLVGLVLVSLLGWGFTLWCSLRFFPTA